MDTTSYWIDTGPLPRFSPPGADVTVDVVVVGGGLTGITAAYLLKQAGLSVALVERGRCARVDTGSTTAHLTNVTDERLHHLIRTFGPKAARAVWDAGGAALDRIVDLIRAEDIACDFRWVPGYLHVPVSGAKPDAVDEVQKEAEAATQLGIPANYLPAVPLFEVPGIEFPHQAIFHPRKYLAALLRRIPGKGSHVFESSAVEEVLERPLAVKAAGFRIRGHSLILATHTPLMGNTGLASALVLQTRLALYTSYALGAQLPAQGLPEGAWWDTADPYYYLRVQHRRGYDYAIFGGEDHKTGQESNTTGSYQRLEKKFLTFAPRAKIDHRWSGQVIHTNDGLPLIGETAPHQFVATGYAGNGMTFGTLGAMMAADAVLKRKNPWQELFDVHRKKVIGGTWDYLAENKDYPYFLVRDRLAKSEGKSLSVLRRGEGRILSLDGHKVAAYRSPTGEVSLCSPVCTHLQCIVGWNKAEGTWDCPCHGARFTPTGEVIAGPAEEPLKKVPLPSEKISARHMNLAGWLHSKERKLRPCRKPQPQPREATPVRAHHEHASRR